MNTGLAILLGLLPAVMLGGGAMICAGIALLRPRTRPSLYRWLTLLATVAAFIAALFELGGMGTNHNGVGLVAYGGGLMIDRFHVFGTVLVCAVLVLAVLGSEAYMRRVPARAARVSRRLARCRRSRARRFRVSRLAAIWLALRDRAGRAFA